MRTAVLVFMCVIGVTLALPSFRTHGQRVQEKSQMDTRIASLLEQILQTKGSNTQQARGESGESEDECKNVEHPCGEQHAEWGSEGHWICAFEELDTVYQEFKSTYSDLSGGKQLFTQQEEFFFEAVANIFGIDVYEKLEFFFSQLGEKRFEQLDWDEISDSQIEDIKNLECEMNMVKDDLRALFEYMYKK